MEKKYWSPRKFTPGLMSLAANYSSALAQSFETKNTSQPVRKPSLVGMPIFQKSWRILKRLKMYDYRISLWVSLYATALAACQPMGGFQKPPTSVEPNITKIGMAGSTPTLLMIREGTVNLAFASPADVNHGFFDFDRGEFVDPSQDRADIRAGITRVTDTFLVIGPTDGASGYFLRTDPVEAADENTWTPDECAKGMDKFLSGGMPIAYVGDMFCWLTNEGSLVQIAIERIDFSEGKYTVPLRYMVWSR